MCFVRNNVSGLVVAFVAKYERYIVAHDAKEFQKTFRLGHGKVARQYRRNGQGKICEFNDVEPRKFHKAVYAVSAHTVLFTTQVQVSCVGFITRCPSGRLPHVVCFILDQTIVASDKCLSYARILLFPTGT